MNTVFSLRCYKCDIRVKVVGETDPEHPRAKYSVRCPRCNEEQILSASKIVSVTEERPVEFP
jgi:hypothetical protein